MKAKKIIALAVSAAMVAGAAACLTACTPGNNDDGGKGGYVEDTRIWYAVGKDTKGTLKNQGWNQNDSTFKFVRDTTVTDENVFTLELDIYAGNVGTGYSFKFLYKNTEDEAGDWTHQYGIHAFEGMDGYEGDDLDSVIKIDGVTVFTTAADNGDNGSNMALEKGQEGTYKFTLKTQNATDAPKLSVERVKTIAVTHDMYVGGDFNNFSTLVKNRIEMTENVGSDTVHTTWSAQITVDDKDLWRTATGELVPESEADATVPNGTGEYTAIQIINNRDNDRACTTVVGTDYKTATVSFNKKDYSCILLPKGSYTIVYDQNDNNVTITAGTHKMYFRGEKALEGLSWNTTLTEADAAFMLNESADGSYWYYELKPVADGKVKLYNGLKTGDNGWVGVSDLEVKAGSTYFIKFTLEGEIVEIEEYKYWVIGTFLTEDGNKVDFEVKSGVTLALEAGEGSIYTATLNVKDVTAQYDWLTHSDWCNNTENVKMCIKLVYGAELAGKTMQNAGEKWGNYYITEEGEFTITYNSETPSLTVTKK